MSSVSVLVHLKGELHMRQFFKCLRKAPPVGGARARLDPRKTPARASVSAQLLLEVLEGRDLPSVLLGTNFAGLGFPDTQGDVPPDTCGAAGPVHYVETVNQTLRISNKTTSAAVATDNSTGRSPRSETTCPGPASGRR
jgi:hypothetical protein